MEICTYKEILTCCSPFKYLILGAHVVEEGDKVSFPSLCQIHKKPHQTQFPKTLKLHYFPSSSSEFGC